MDALLGFNTHPPLSAFPVVLIVLVLGCEVAAYIFRKTAKPPIANFLSVAAGFNLSLAAVAVTAAFFSGYQASDYASQTFIVSNDLIEQHHLAGRSLLFLIFPCLALRFISKRAEFNKNVFRFLYVVSLCVAGALVFYTGYLGGRLVFVHGAGVVAPLSNQK